MRRNLSNVGFLAAGLAASMASVLFNDRDRSVKEVKPNKVSSTRSIKEGETRQQRRYRERMSTKRGKR